MKIKELMTRAPGVLTPESTIAEAAQAMADMDVGSLPVLRKGRVVGMLTDRDIVVRALAEGLPPATTKVEFVMTADVVSCSEEDEAEDAAELMAANRVRRLVVLDETGRFTGVASLADLALATSGIVEDVLRKISSPPEELTQGIYTGGPAAVDHQPAESDAAVLVKDELAAIETYKQVLQTVHSGRAADELRRIENEHEEAAKALMERLVKMGIEAPAAPDGQGAWLEAQEESAELLDAKRSIALLKEAEEREIEDYERTLRDESLDSGLRRLIASRLLPRTRAHVPQLARFLGEGPVA